MLKRMFALSDQGSRDLNKGIAATTLSNLCLIAPVSLLVMVIWELLNVISGQESSMRDHAALFIGGTVVMFIIVFLTQWLQYNKTYTVAYEESANRRIVLAEKLPTPVKRIGVNDEFGHSGPAGALLKAFGLSAEHIVEAAKSF